MTDIRLLCAVVFNCLICGLIKFIYSSAKMSDLNPAEYFVCGGFGGICTVLVGHPLDTIKVGSNFLCNKYLKWKKLKVDYESSFHWQKAV